MRIVRFALSVAFALAAGCSNSQSYPMCGNGVVEMGESCDRGADNGKAGINCDATCRSVTVLIPQINLVWSLLRETPVPGYRGSNCDAIGATKAHVIVSGPTRIEQTLDCARYGKLFTGVCTELADGGTGDCSMHLAPGTYDGTVELLRGDGSAITRAVSAGTKMVQPGQPVNLAVDFHQEDFLVGFTGSLQVKLNWGTDQTPCMLASPPAQKESLVLIPYGATTPLTAKTMGGTRLDGTPNACYTPMGSIYAEEARDLPWGPYHLRVRGYGGAADPIYCGAFDVFIGPTNNNQPWVLTIPPAPSMDGGIGDGGTGCP